MLMPKLMVRPSEVTTLPDEVNAVCSSPATKPDWMTCRVQWPFTAPSAFGRAAPGPPPNRTIACW